MIGGFDSRLWVAVLIALAVVAGAMRLLAWQRSAPVDARSPRWRLALLVALQLAAGALLHLGLFPPGVPIRAGALVVATSGAPRQIATTSGDVLVALPETGIVEGAIRVPDLATALRRFPGAARVRVEGAGLPPRDQGPLPLPLAFEAPAIPRGLIDLALPGWSTAGAPFSVGGQIGSLSAGTVELVDPAGAIVDRVRVATGRRFVVKSNTRAAGLALFSLRLRDAAGAVVERLDVPVEARAQTRPRVLVLAGAPGAETRHLRRWAEGAGIDLGIDIDLGGGVRIGDAPVPLTRASLQDVDLVIIDDRRWETTDAAARAALADAVDAGMGLLLRPTGPLSGSTRRDWAALGVPLTGGEATAPLRLAPDGPRTTDPPAAAAPPELTRRAIGHEGPNSISLLRGGDGVALASWRSRGRGRVGVWTVADSYVLVLTGEPERYGEMWSELFSALARPGEGRPARVDGFARRGQRLAICGLNGDARAIDPSGAARSLLVDPAAGDQACAAYWPVRSGWHVARDGGGRETTFYVHPEGAAPSLIAFANREATIALATASRKDRADAPAPQVAGPSWPWFIALLAILGLLWWLERKRPARRELSGTPSP